jgi:hypothetical protein
MKTYKIEFELTVEEEWVNDGLNAKTIKRRVKEELPGNLLPYALNCECEVKKIKVNLIKK